MEEVHAFRQQDSQIGFGAPIRANMRAGGVTNAAITSSLLETVESSELIAYGLIPEFIGRFPILVSLLALTEDQRVLVMMAAVLQDRGSSTPAASNVGLYRPLPVPSRPWCEIIMYFI